MSKRQKLLEWRKDHNRFQFLIRELREQMEAIQHNKNLVSETITNNHIRWWSDEDKRKYQLQHLGDIDKALQKLQFAMADLEKEFRP